MSRFKRWWLVAALFTVIWMVACGSDEPEANSSFTVGDAGASGEGRPRTGDGGEAGQPAQAGTAGSASGGTAQTGGAATAAGAAGAEPEQPPYDCVLHPTTHLEIINACTDALHVEKHPTLPALPSTP